MMHTWAHTEAQISRRRAECAGSSSSRPLGSLRSEKVPPGNTHALFLSQISSALEDQKPELCAVARLRLLSFCGAHRTRNRTRPGARHEEAMSSRQVTATRASDQGRLLPTASSAGRALAPDGHHARARRPGMTPQSFERTSTAAVREGSFMGDVDIGTACIVCWRAGTDRAHLIDRSLASDPESDPLRTVRLCRSHHDAYDRHELDLLPYLEPRHRAELAKAVEVHGLISTLERVTGQHWTSTTAGAVRFEVARA